MRLDDEEMSENVEKRSGGGLRTIGIGGGIGGIIVIVLALLFKQDPQQVMQAVQQVQGPGGTETAEQLTQNNAAPIEIFSAKVLRSTERVWQQEFQKLNKTYVNPRMVSFEGSTTSGCGFAESAMGPFYCPADQRVYLDVSFFNELQNRFGVEGEFARAYVIAHEVGHHVQNLLGISEKMQSMRSRLSEKEYNKLSVMLELQADFLAGLWANHANKQRNILEPGDIESGLNAASAVGDDKLQQAGTGQVVPDAFTHGTSAQRMYWFKKGFETGDLSQGDTGIGLGDR